MGAGSTRLNALAPVTGAVCEIHGPAGDEDEYMGKPPDPDEGPVGEWQPAAQPVNSTKAIRTGQYGLVRLVRELLTGKLLCLGFDFRWPDPCIPPSVLGRMLDAIDDEHRHRNLLSSEFQSQLVLQGLKDR